MGSGVRVNGVGMRDYKIYKETFEIIINMFKILIVSQVHIYAKSY